MWRATATKNVKKKQNINFYKINSDIFIITMNATPGALRVVSWFFPPPGCAQRRKGVSCSVFGAMLSGSSQHYSKTPDRRRIYCGSQCQRWWFIMEEKAWHLGSMVLSRNRLSLSEVPLLVTLLYKLPLLPLNVSTAAGGL